MIGSTSTSSHYSLTRSTFAASSRSHHSTGRLSLAEPAPPAPTTPVPTFHALTNLRFPPTTPATITTAYEELCREVFGILGRRSDSTPSTQHLPRASDEEAATRGFVNPLAHCLEGMVIQLDRAGLVGPLIQLLALISHLVLLFPAFSIYFLNASPSLVVDLPTPTAGSKFIPLLARLLKRFGRPPSPSKIASDLAASTPGGASLQLTGGKGKAKERSRRVRGVVMRPQQMLNGAKGALKDGEEEKIELDSVKRERLLGKVLECLEGLAWRGGENMEEQ